MLRKQGDGRYLAEVRLAHGTLKTMDKHRRVMSWTTDHWNTINYYLLNRQNTGLGHKLFEIPKDAHAEMFGKNEPEATIESIVGRIALVALKPVH